jgi:hypothetical protein
VTGIERKQVEDAQKRLEQRRWERDHFSDGTPVTLNMQWAPEPEATFGVLDEGNLDAY